MTEAVKEIEKWSAWSAATLVGAGLAGLIGAMGYCLNRGPMMTKLEKAFVALVEQLCAKLAALEEECEKLRARPTQEDYSRIVKENGELRAQLSGQPPPPPTPEDLDFDSSGPRGSGRRRKQRRANV